MKKLHIFFLPVLVFTFLLTFNSCEGCVKKTTKKATEIGISAMEGVVEAVDERGEEFAEKTTEAAGKVAVGTGRSLDNLINEHAETVAASAGRTFVQTLEGLDKGATAQYYDEIAYTSDICPGVSLDLFGKIKSKAVVDAYFIILEIGTYSCKFEFIGSNGKTFLTKETEIVKDSASRRYSLVSFALNDKEEAGLKNIKEVKVTVNRE